MAIPTVAELAGMPTQRWGYVLFLEGVPWAFTDELQLVGNFEEFSWIGASNGNREVLLGLEVPEALTQSTSLESGMLEKDGLEFGIKDFDFNGGKLIYHFQEVDPRLVGERLGPKDDPAPGDLLTPDGLNSEVLWGKWLNQESIGQFGERRQFQVFPGDPLPGYDHATITSDINTLAPSAVFDAPHWLVGRKVSLYRIYKDVTDAREISAAWPSWDQQDASGYSRIWWGTVSDASAEGHEWKIKCEGPSSWLRKELNANRPAAWDSVVIKIKLNDQDGQREDLMAIDCYQVNAGAATTEWGSGSNFDPAFDAVPTSGDSTDYRDAIHSRLTDILGFAGADITWNASREAQGYFGNDSVTVQIESGGTDPWCAVYRITLHEKVWRLLGWDPTVQVGVNFDSTFEVKFRKANPTIRYLGIDVATPAPGYWQATFTTIPLGFSTIQEAGQEIDNGGKLRSYTRLNPPNQSAMYPEGNQEIIVGLGPSTPYLEGQTNRPPADYEMSYGQAASATGYFAFRGKRKDSLDGDEIEEVQIAKVSWEEVIEFGGPTYGQDGEAFRLAHIDFLLQPRWFGIDRPLIDRTWASIGLEFCPFAFAGYNHEYGDRADLVLLDLMLSTGTASWTGFEGDPDAVQTLGSNAHPDGVEHGNDTEIADLGLGIWNELIDLKSFAEAAKQSPGGINSALNRCKFGFIGPFDSQEVIARILEPRGWALGMKGNKYSLWSMPQLLTLDDVEVALSPTDFDSPDQPFVEQVELTPLSPIDSMSIRFGESMTGSNQSELALEYKGRARDPGSRVRHGNASKDIDGQGMVPFALGVGTPWSSEWAQLWQQTMSEWRAAPHIMIRDLPIRPSKMKDCHVGTVVRLTSDWAPTREGHYGLAGKVGRIVKTKRALRPGPSTIDILIQPGDPAVVRRFGPVAWVKDPIGDQFLENRIDADLRKIYIYTNYFGREDDIPEGGYFCEPNWSQIGGGLALVYGYQWDGRSWSKTFEFRAESFENLSLTTSSLTWQDGSFDGEFKERMYTVLTMAPWDLQDAAWVQSIFSVITRADTKFGASDTPGYKLLP